MSDEISGMMEALRKVEIIFDSFTADLHCDVDMLQLKG